MALNEVLGYGIRFGEGDTWPVRQSLLRHVRFFGRELRTGVGVVDQWDSTGRILLPEVGAFDAIFASTEIEEDGLVGDVELLEDGNGFPGIGPNACRR